MVKTAISQSESSPAKRKLDDTTNGSSAKKRTRVSFSCGECHRRKQKCDRQTPCNHCISRKVPHLCKAYTPGKAEQDISYRLSRLEQIIELALPQYCANGPPSLQTGNSSGIEDETYSQIEENDANGGAFQSDGKWYGVSATGSIAPRSLLEQIQSVSGGPSNELLETERQLEPTASDNLRTLVQECGVSPHKISELLHDLPPRRASDVLVDYYFKSVNWTRYPISEKDFRASYDSVVTHSADGIGATNANDVCFLGLLFVVLAISVRVAPEKIAGDTKTRRVTSLRYYWSSRRSILIAAAIQPDTLWIVLTRLLSARFLTFDRRITECWSQLGAAVRTAQALGLHRDGSTMGMDPQQVEYRRRVWSYLYHADRSYSLVLGRPTSIQDYYTSTHPPSNISEDGSAKPSLTTPTPMTYVILRHQLAAIIGKIVHHFQQVRSGASYSDVAALDDELLRFIAHLPPHYCLEPDTSLDESHSFIPVHRYLLITEILFVRTSLHRPYILRRLKSDRYARSRAACFESALKDFQVRQDFRETHAEATRQALSNAYREFQTAMISGIYLVLEPNGQDADGMHAIMDQFLQDNNAVGDLDETTRRELKIIEFLKTKASQMKAFPPIANESIEPSNAAGHGPENAAQLLLGLQQPASHSPAPATPNFPSLSNLTTSYVSTSSDPSQLATSPTFQRLQMGDGTSSSGSPAADDAEASAQSLLDMWCSSMNSGTVDSSTGFMNWSANPADFPVWQAPPGPPNAMGNADLVPTGMDGGDWNHWEALINQIQRPS